MQREQGTRGGEQKKREIAQRERNVSFCLVLSCEGSWVGEPISRIAPGISDKCIMTQNLKRNADSVGIYVTGLAGGGGAPRTFRDDVGASGCRTFCRCRVCTQPALLFC